MEMSTIPLLNPSVLPCVSFRLKTTIPYLPTSRGNQEPHPATKLQPHNKPRTTTTASTLVDNCNRKSFTRKQIYEEVKLNDHKADLSTTSSERSNAILTRSE
ncbi:unnamed protein product [Cuscuta campestris]|uniref:Uncharacterized protein n=1 Tax=Cuscuta campestris TaxID=132261 RepID=A0A484MM37_9ASTE|nr:unnamed protein product [Cuscuta campestris]